MDSDFGHYVTFSEKSIRTFFLHGVGAKPLKGLHTLKQSGSKVPVIIFVPDLEGCLWRTPDNFFKTFFCCLKHVFGKPLVVRVNVPDLETQFCQQHFFLALPDGPKTNQAFFTSIYPNCFTSNWSLNWVWTPKYTHFLPRKIAKHIHRGSCLGFSIVLLPPLPLPL